VRAILKIALRGYALRNVGVVDGDAISQLYEARKTLQNLSDMVQACRRAEMVPGDVLELFQEEAEKVLEEPSDVLPRDPL
jgi:hypothetical protein